APMPARRPPRRRRSGSRPLTRPPGSSWPASWPRHGSPLVPPSDVSDSFLLRGEPPDIFGSEPALPAAFSTAQAGEIRLPMAIPANEIHEQTRNSRSLPLPLGLIGSLGVHLLPFLLLVNWA